MGAAHRPTRSLPFRREGSRNRSGHGCLRVRNRPRKRRAPQGRCAWGVENSCRHAPGASAQDDLRGSGGAARRAPAGRRRARGVLRRRRCPHRALRRTGRGAVLVACARGGVESAEYAPERVKQMVCGYGHADKAQVQRMVQGDPRAAEAPDAEPCRRRARGRDLPRARAAAPEGCCLMIARLRGKAVARAGGRARARGRRGRLPRPADPARRAEGAREGRGRRRDVPARAGGRPPALRLRRR